MGSGKLGESGMIALTAKIMMAVIIFLFLVVVFIFFLHLYAKWFWGYRQEDNGNPNAGTRRQRRRRFDFGGGYQEVNVLRSGLDPSILKTIPVVPFNIKDFKDGLECSVCLSEVSEGENTRVLPKCKHGFHVDCIDMWFHSHSTCPLCRNPVSEQSAESISETIGSSVEEGSASTETQNIPTNVLFWGDETSTTSSASTSNRPDGILVIDIPRQNTEQEEEEGQKTPTSTRLRSLTRLFSRVNPYNVDVEQGSRGQS
ncbi:RING-H2 finger protein ATL60-like [Nicotiana tabacum]|uniref:RING-H2 finger protein ATL60-like n=1 Tax=Nicotiana tabacum TaxID=4097 RepID=UPI003F4E9F2E